MPVSERANLPVQEVRRRAAYEAAKRAQVAGNTSEIAAAHREALNAELAKPLPDPILVADHAWAAGRPLLELKKLEEVLLLVDQVEPLLQAATKTDGVSHCDSETIARLVPLLDLRGRALLAMSKPNAEVDAVYQQIRELLFATWLRRRFATQCDGWLRVACFLSRVGEWEECLGALESAREAWERDRAVSLFGYFWEAKYITREALERAIGAVQAGGDIAWLARRPVNEDPEPVAYCYGCPRWPSGVGSKPGRHPVDVTCLVARERRRRNLRVTQLADAAQVPRNDLKSWEHGESAPTPAQAARIAAVLEVAARLLWPNGLAGGIPADAPDGSDAEDTFPEITFTATPHGSLGGPLAGLVTYGPHAYVGIGRRIARVDCSDPQKPRITGSSEILPGLVKAGVVWGKRPLFALGEAGYAIVESELEADVRVKLGSIAVDCLQTLPESELVLGGFGEKLAIIDPNTARKEHAVDRGRWDDLHVEGQRVVLVERYGHPADVRVYRVVDRELRLLHREHIPHEIRESTLRSGILALHTAKGEILFFRIDTGNGHLKDLGSLPSRSRYSYPALIWHGERLIITYAVDDVIAICFKEGEDSVPFAEDGGDLAAALDADGELSQPTLHIAGEGLVFSRAPATRFLYSKTAIPLTVCPIDLAFDGQRWWSLASDALAEMQIGHDIAMPRDVLKLPGAQSAVVATENRAFVLTVQSGHLFVIDTTTSPPSLVGDESLKEAVGNKPRVAGLGLALAGRLLGAALGSSGVHLYTIDEKERIRARSVIATDRPVRGLALANGCAYTVTPDALRIYDVTNPDSPQHLYRLPLANGSCVAVDDDHIAYIGCGDEIVAAKVADSEAPRRLWRANVAQKIQSIRFFQGRLYATTKWDDVMVFDVARLKSAALASKMAVTRTSQGSQTTENVELVASPQRTPGAVPFARRQWYFFSLDSEVVEHVGKAIAGHPLRGVHARWGRGWLYSNASRSELLHFIRQRYGRDMVWKVLSTDRTFNPVVREELATAPWVCGRCGQSGQPGEAVRVYSIDSKRSLFECVDHPICLVAALFLKDASLLALDPAEQSRANTRHYCKSHKSGSLERRCDDVAATAGHRDNGPCCGSVFSDRLPTDGIDASTSRDTPAVVASGSQDRPDSWRTPRSSGGNDSPDGPRKATFIVSLSHAIKDAPERLALAQAHEQYLAVLAILMRLNLQIRKDEDENVYTTEIPCTRDQFPRLAKRLIEGGILTFSVHCAPQDRTEGEFVINSFLPENPVQFYDRSD